MWRKGVAGSHTHYTGRGLWNHEDNFTFCLGFSSTLSNLITFLKFQDDGKALSLSPPLAAGLKTFDPLPVRKDQRPSLPSSDAKTPSSTELSDQTVSDPVSKSAKDPASSYWSPSCRIQGTLRDPEFQHNGWFASHKTFCSLMWV